MNWIDLIIILVILAFAIEGQSSGFLGQALNILGFAFSLMVALALYSQMGSFLTKIFNLSPIAAAPVAFLIVWIVTESLFFLIINLLIAKHLVKFENNKYNKILGFLPAIANALLFLAFLLLLFVSLPLRPDIKNDIFKSKIGSVLINKAITLERPLDKVFGPITKQGLTFLTVNPEEKGSVDLHFKQDQLTIDYTGEQQMLNLVNTQRAEAGVEPLVWDDSMAGVAQAHSEDMFRKGYFSHYSPEGKDVGDRLNTAGIAYTYAGENLALAPNIQSAYGGLMNSPGHRRNILDPAFHKIGIGALNGGVYGEMITQVFVE
jgi:uncharacterized membrane protein required for colicin V production